MTGLVLWHYYIVLVLLLESIVRTKRTKLYCECGIAVGLFIFYSLFSIFYDKFEHLPAFLSDRFCLVWGIEKISIIVFSVFVFDI